jgi:hypothetical protein
LIYQAKERPDPSASLPSGLSLRVEDRMVSLSFDFAQDSELVELSNHKSGDYRRPLFPFFPEVRVIEGYKKVLDFGKETG